MYEEMVKEVLEDIECRYNVKGEIIECSTIQITTKGKCGDYLDKLSNNIVEYIREYYELDCDYITEIGSISLQILI